MRGRRQKLSLIILTSLRPSQKPYGTLHLHTSLTIPSWEVKHVFFYLVFPPKINQSSVRKEKRMNFGQTTSCLCPPQYSWIGKFSIMKMIFPSWNLNLDPVHFPIKIPTENFNGIWQTNSKTHMEKSNSKG